VRAGVRERADEHANLTDGASTRPVAERGEPVSSKAGSPLATMKGNHITMVTRTITPRHGTNPLAQANANAKESRICWNISRNGDLHRGPACWNFFRKITTSPYYTTYISENFEEIAEASGLTHIRDVTAFV
jgi:hypothetical protein